MFSVRSVFSVVQPPVAYVLVDRLKPRNTQKDIEKNTERKPTTALHPSVKLNAITKFDPDLSLRFRVVEMRDGFGDREESMDIGVE